MRNKKFVAEHRGGPLTKQQHQDLLVWASKCVNQVLVHIGEDSNPSLKSILDIGEAWKNGKASVGDARNAAFCAIGIAKELNDPQKVSAVRAVGHVVAVAHMADHSIRAADYALKALNECDRDLEKQWQNKQLPTSIRELVIEARK
jgi:hypothetical protein